MKTTLKKFYRVIYLHKKEPGMKTTLKAPFEQIFIQKQMRDTTNFGVPELLLIVLLLILSPFFSSTAIKLTLYI